MLDVFCLISQKKEPAHIIFEDEDVIAFLDKEPFSDGHTLIIPKKHYKDINEIDKKVLQKIIITASIISKKIKEEFGYDGTVVLHNSGKLSDIPHFHLHICGKNAGKKFSADYKKQPLDKISRRLKL